MNKTLYAWVIGSMISLQAIAAVDLCDVYQHAIKHDPTYQAALARYDSALEAKPQARALLLPDLRASSQLTHVKQMQNTNSNIAAFASKGRQHSYNLTLTQPLIAYDRMQSYLQADFTVQQAFALRQVAEQELMTRVVRAYFAVLEAQDNLQFVRAEKKANLRQLEQAKQRHKVGLDAITSVYNAQASYDIVAAQAIAAKNTVNNQFEALRAITGKRYQHLKSLKAKSPLRRPKPDNIKPWVQQSLGQNWQLKAARANAKAVERSIAVQKSGHLPTVSLSAQLDGGLSHSGRGDNRNQSATVGLSMNWPLFQSGLVVSRTRQARSNYDVAIAELDQVKRQVITATQQTYHNITAGISQIEANMQAVKSADSSMKSTDTALKAGTRTIVDLINAQRDLYSAQRQLAASRYRYINDSLSLKALAGMLTYEDIQLVNRWLA